MCNYKVTLSTSIIFFDDNSAFEMWTKFVKFNKIQGFLTRAFISSGCELHCLQSLLSDTCSIFSNELIVLWIIIIKFVLVLEIMSSILWQGSAKGTSMLKNLHNLEIWKLLNCQSKRWEQNTPLNKI